MCGKCTLQRIYELLWYAALKRNTNGSCYARFLPRKLLKTVLLRTAAHDFFAEFACYAQKKFPFEQGPATAQCHLKVRGVFHNPFVKRTKKNIWA